MAASVYASSGIANRGFTGSPGAPRGTSYPPLRPGARPCAGPGATRRCDRLGAGRRRRRAGRAAATSPPAAAAVSSSSRAPSNNRPAARGAARSRRTRAGDVAALPRVPPWSGPSGNVSCQRLEARREAAEREQETLPLGSLHGGARGVEARAVHLGGRWGEGRRDGPAAARHHPFHLGESEAELVGDLPRRLGGLEETLQLVSERDGEARGEEAAVAGVEMLQRGAERGLESGASRRGEGAGVDGVGDEGDVDGFCHNWLI